MVQVKSQFLASAIFLSSSFMCMAQSTGVSPANTLEETSEQAQLLYGKHSYAQAAAVLKGLSGDPSMTLLPEWPDTLYNLACDQALANHAEKALQDIFLGQSGGRDDRRD
jgi:hypothetical protein